MGQYWFTPSSKFDPHEPELNELFREQILAMRAMFGLRAGDLGTELCNGGWKKYYSVMAGADVEVQLLLTQWNIWGKRDYADVFSRSTGNHNSGRTSYTPVFRINLRVRQFVPDTSISVDMTNPGLLKRIAMKLLDFIGAVEKVEVTDENRDHPGMVPSIFFDRTVEIIFDRDFPVRPPAVFLPDHARYDVSNGEEHHIYKNRQMCILADPYDWDSKKTVVDAIFAAVDWIVWHHKKFNWS